MIPVKGNEIHFQLKTGGKGEDDRQEAVEISRRQREKPAARLNLRFWRFNLSKEKSPASIAADGAGTDRFIPNVFYGSYSIVIASEGHVSAAS
jgi:hypothetical protein